MCSDELYIGLISGTSADGIDAALVSFDSGIPNLLATHLEPIPETVRKDLQTLFTPGDNEQLDLMGELDVIFGELLAQAACNLCEKAGVSLNRIKAVGSHGQTVRHRPNLRNPFTLQIGDAHRVAQALKRDVIADFRRRDMATGGQGAPLAPAFHRAFLSSASESRVILNLGGIANITYLPTKGEPLAFDTGPANGLMDAWIEKHLQCAYDRDGAWAASGKPQQKLINTWLGDSYFLQLPPKSTGKEHFHLDWLQRQTPRISEFKPEDIQASLLELTVQSVTQSIQHYCPHAQRILICGGGAHNTALRNRLNDVSTSPVETTSSLGIDPDWVEAMAFAWFAKQHRAFEVVDLRPFTGAKMLSPMGTLFPAGYSQ